VPHKSKCAVIEKLYLAVKIFPATTRQCEAATTVKEISSA